jgi:hypothetical protein
MRETDDRTGGKVRLLKPTEDEIEIFSAGGLGEPQLLEFVDGNGIQYYYVRADEYERWKAGTQAGDAQ